MKVSDDRRKRLILAAETRTSVSHPHLLPARVVRDNRGRTRILLQRYPVPILSEVLSSGPLEVRTSLRLLYGVATAAGSLHTAGLVARDLQPDRILVCPRRGGILADLGIPLELLPRDSSPDDPDSPFRSPEEQAGLPIDGRSNVYSLAAVFLATMTAPDGERLALPAPAKSVVGRGMAIEPERRYASPPEFIVTLASAFGFPQRAGSGGKRSSAAAPKDEAAAVTELPSAPEPPAGAQTVVSPRGNAAPEPARAESGSYETRPRRSPDQNEPRPAPDPAVPPPGRPKGAPARRPRSETGSSPRVPASVRSRPEQSEAPAGRRTRPFRPRLRLPTAPRLSAPTLTRLRPLSLPQLRRPSLPQLRRPSLPQLRPPSLPQLRPPSLPQLRPPNLPQLRAPKLPRVSATAIRRVSARTLPRLHAPSRLTAAGIPLALAVVGFFIAGTLLGRNAPDEPKPALIERSSFTVRLPAGWGETKVDQAGGIDLSAPVAAAPLGEGGAGLVVAGVPDIVTLDRRFRTEAGAEGSRTEVQLGRLEAWRYTGLPAKRGVVATTYLAPTTADPLLFICHARRSDARTRLAECQDIASTVALRGERPASLAAVTRHMEQLVSVMASLRRERFRARRRLAGVELAADQAQAARQLERTYEDAAARLAEGEPPAGTSDVDDLVGSLQLTARAYGRLADAAADADEAGYRAASEAVLEGEEAVRRDAADSEPA
jgi:serine/threonine protein kinase